MSSSTTAAGAASTLDASSSGLSILIADKFEPKGRDRLETLGCRITFDPDIAAEQMAAAIQSADPDVLVVRGTKVNAAAINATPTLSLVVRAGAGYDSIDVAEASARGVFVANCPGKNSIAVAELAWALILSCDRRVPDQTADLREGKWKKKEYAQARGLYGRTLGVVGMGRIGCEVAARGRAFGMKVVGWSRSLTEERADELGIGFCSNLINLAKIADVISINVAANADTAQLIGSKFCAALKPEAYLINTSRGSVVDSASLCEAIRDKGVRAGLDVFGDEPGTPTGTFTDSIVREPGVYGTHHVGASTDQAQQSVADEAVRIIEAYQTAGVVHNCVNKATTTTANNLLTVRHLNRPGVLAHVFYTLGQAGINVEEMQNVIYAGAKAACARIQLDETPSDEQVNAIRANDDVLSVTLTGIRDEA